MRYIMGGAIGFIIGMVVSTFMALAMISNTNQVYYNAQEHRAEQVVVYNKAVAKRVAEAMDKMEVLYLDCHYELPYEESP